MSFAPVLRDVRGSGPPDDGVRRVAPSGIRRPALIRPAGTFSQRGWEKGRTPRAARRAAGSSFSRAREKVAEGRMRAAPRSGAEAGHGHTG